MQSATAVIIRPSLAGDLPHLINLLTQLGYSQSITSLEHNISAVRRQGGDVFVAQTDAGIAGCVSAILDARLAEGVNGEIVSLVVDESARGTGTGKALVRYAEKWLAEYTTTIRIKANTLRQDVLEYYTKLGYRQLKTQAVFTRGC